MKVKQTLTDVLKMKAAKKLLIDELKNWKLSNQKYHEFDW